MTLLNLLFCRSTHSCRVTCRPRYFRKLPAASASVSWLQTLPRRHWQVTSILPGSLWLDVVCCVCVDVDIQDVWANARIQPQVLPSALLNFLKSSLLGPQSSHLSSTRQNSGIRYRQNRRWQKSQPRSVVFTFDYFKIVIFDFVQQSVSNWLRLCQVGC